MQKKNKQCLYTDLVIIAIIMRERWLNSFYDLMNWMTVELVTVICI